MSVTVTASTRRLASYSVTNLSGLSIEAEIRSLCSFAPDAAAVLPKLFAESVVESCSSIVGPSSGEALVRRIGDRRLQSPDLTYRRIDGLLRGGSDTLKRAIEQRFRTKVHRLYRASMNLEVKRLSAA